MGVFKAAVRMTMNGETMYNVLGFSTDDSTAALLQTLTDIIAQRYASDLAPICSDNWTFEDVTWYDQQAPLGTPGITQIPTSGTFTGTSTADPLPRMVAGLVSLVCTFGPPFRGRVYICGISETFNTASGLVDAVAQNAMDSWANGLRADIIASGTNNRWNVVRANPGNGSEPDRGLVSAIAVRDKWFTQRRRNNSS